MCKVEIVSSGYNKGQLRYVQIEDVPVVQLFAWKLSTKAQTATVALYFKVESFWQLFWFC